MACLRKKGNKYYVKAYENGKEKWYKTGTSVRRVAEVELEKYETAKKLGLPSPFASETPLKLMLAAFCLYLKGSTNAKNYPKELSLLRMLFGPACAALGGSDDVENDAAFLNYDHPYLNVKNFEKIETRHLTDLQDVLADEPGLGPKTLNNYREMAYRFVNWAITQKGKRFPGGVNPIDKARIREVDLPVISYLMPDEIRQQLDALKDFLLLQCMVAVLIFAGLRREELLWLRTGDIQTHEGQLTILVRAKTIDGIFWQPKTKKNRSVPVGLSLRPYLDRIFDGVSGDRWLFTTAEGEQWTGDGFYAALRDANLAASKKLTDDGKDAMPIWSALDFRHTFGTMLASSGVSLFIIADWMGNSPEICRKHYAHLIQSLLHKYVEFMKPAGVATAHCRIADAVGRVIPDMPPADASDPPVTATPWQPLRLVVNNRRMGNA
jgi:integrase